MTRPNVSGENRAPLNPLETPSTTPDVNVPSTNANPAVFSKNAPWVQPEPAVAPAPKLSPTMKGFTPDEISFMQKLNSTPMDDGEQQAETNILKNIESAWLEALINEGDIL